MVIPCIKLRNEIAENIKIKIAELKSRGVSPTFAIIQIGDNSASNTYIQVKTKKAKELGIETKIYKFQIQNPNFQTEIEKLIVKLSSDKTIHGIIIQRPLPPNFDEKKLQSLINPNKDIDGLSENSPFVNPLVQAVLHAIKYTLSQNSLPTTKHILRTVVIGKGKSAGTPIYEYFFSNPIISLPTTTYSLQPITQIDSKTPNPTEILKNANLIISCVGKPKIINAKNIKRGVVLISVGQHLENQNDNEKKVWKGDYDEDEISSIASAYTRTPGGIGPLNVIFLLKNVIQAI